MAPISWHTRSTTPAASDAIGCQITLQEHADSDRLFVDGYGPGSHRHRLHWTDLLDPPKGRAAAAGTRRSSSWSE